MGEVESETHFRSESCLWLFLAENWFRWVSEPAITDSTKRPRVIKYLYRGLSSKSASLVRLRNLDRLSWSVFGTRCDLTRITMELSAERPTSRNRYRRQTQLWRGI